MRHGLLWLYFYSGLLFYSVIKLQHVISSETGIPVESQVLLISGGEPMSPNSRVCTYSAGTVSINCIHTFLDLGQFAPVLFIIPLIF